uniref:Zinc finger protein 37 homolog n=1 Tax=Saccoglossus kowalevskii TaxID=10224 RepID=A0ABM0MRR8_SACKO|nr:PREDICTED: zinc finger protein 37 homolog [Saccoglossus kowalevskii]
MFLTVDGLLKGKLHEQKMKSSEEPVILTEKRALFQKALDLTSKFKASVFIIVSEIDNPSEYWGSVDFVKDFQTTGLKVRSHDVEIFPVMSSDIYLDSNTTLHSTLTSEDHQETYKGMESDDTERKISIHGNNLNELESTLFMKSDDSSTEVSLLEESDGANSDDTNVEASDVAMVTSESESESVNVKEKEKDLGEIFENEDLLDSVSIQNKKVENNDNNAGSSITSHKQVSRKLTIEERVSRISRLFQESYKSKPFSCDKCDQHRKTYECEICNRKFAAAINVKQHIKRDHTKEGLLKCPTCQKGFLSNYELGYHLASVHSQFDELLPCKHCGKTFTHENNLRAHVRTQHMSTPVQCEVCSKQFRNKAQLKGHLAVHSDKKEECPICHKLFTLRYTLKKHMMVHSDEKPWQCHVCGYRCKLRENLGKHMRVHQKDNSC